MRLLPAVVTVLILALTAVAAPPRPPVKVIFDTDMETDCDDLAALAILHALADRGEAEILATVVSAQNRWSPACVDAVNTFYGRPDLPIGRPKTGPDKPSKYARGIAEQFPHDTRDLDAIPDAAEIYADILSSQPDNSVTVVTVGYLTNLAALLKLPATTKRPSGRDLARRKVRDWICMGGNFVGQPPVDDLKLGNNNFTFDAEAAHYAVTHWPGKITFVGREVGSVPSGLKVGAKLVDRPKDNPIRAGYALYFGGSPKDRHVADPVTVLYAIRGLGDFWDLEANGFMDLNKNMTFRWRPDQDRGHAYIRKRLIDGQPTDRAVEDAINALMLQPPK